ncbi:MAG: hypothetical protein FWF10_11655 [Clostridiales bacterium]|nr:hypothetical protein [Clostridiales bacterium]
MFQKKLREMMEAKSYVSIYKDRDDLSLFGFGCIVACNDAHFILASSDPHGVNDGLQLCKTDTICKIEYNDFYARRMEKLINHYKSKHEDYHFQDDLIMELLEYSKTNAFIVSIEICDSGHFEAIGLVDGLYEEGCRILLIDEYGNEAGYAEIKYSDISQINSNEYDERYRRILYQTSDN